MQRQPAKKIRIKDILDGRFFFGDKDSLEPSYLITRYGMKVSRVNILGTITDKFVSDDENYIFYVVDDGTGDIRVKLFREDAEKYKNFEIGDLVVVIGKIREYLGEIYINGEVIRKVENPNYETMRKLEVAKNILQYKKLVKNLKEAREEMSEEEFENYAKSLGIEKNVLDVIMQFSETEEKDYKDRLMYIIEKLDEGEGVEIEKILEVVNLPIEILESSISELLDEGYIYEPSPGKFKVVKK